MIDEPTPGSAAEVAPRHRLTRFDRRFLLGITLFGFLLRLLSPIMPDVLSSPSHGLVRIWGLGHPYQSPNGYIFDEVYFAQDACRDLKGMDYLDPEPPLSKLVIASGIAISGLWLHYDRTSAPVTKPCESEGTLPGFGTWGWRLASLLAGTLLIPLIYLVALRLWPDRFFAACAAFLMSFDGMSFVQSRIGMIDAIAILVGLSAYLAFLRHRDARDTRAWVRSGLLLGLVIGLAVAAKWVTLAGWGTMLVFLVGGAVFGALRLETGSGWRFGNLRLPRVGPRDAYMRLAFYLVVFITIPALVYFLSYFRYVTIGHDVPAVCGSGVPGCPVGGSWHDAPALLLAHVGPVWLPAAFPNLGAWFTAISHHDQWTYHYHATLTATHTYGSPWYSWPFLLRPVAYYYQDNLGTSFITHQALRSEVFNLGNPAIWWAAIPALVYTGIVALRERSFAAALIVVAFLAAWLPFSRVTRVMFLYHMFGSLPFMMLAVAFTLARLRHFKVRLVVGHTSLPQLTGTHLALAYLGMVLVTFIFFYPLWTGLPITGDEWNMRIWFNLPDAKLSWI
ncbi:MAG: phospholipid carrier-dependent glycosyltransferase [Candidatus Dormibacteria bacterium]